MRILVALLMLIYLQAGQVYAGVANVIDRLPVTEKMVALTVEDVENGEEFAKLINMCDKEGIHVTFFTAKQFIVNNEAAIKKAVAQGHEFGNQGLEREYWVNFSKKKVAAKLAEAGSLLKSTTAKENFIIRPPYAYYSDNVIQGALLYNSAAVIVRGTDISNWNSSVPQAVVEKSTASLENGDIINVNVRAKSTMTALPGIIKDIRAKGYKIVSVSELQAAVSAPQPTTPQNIEPQPEKQPFAVVSRFDIDKPYIALTFDDGGSWRNVSAILDVLNEYGTPSTFFLTGEWASNNPDLVLRIANEGHEIANHSYSHASLSTLDSEQIESEIMAAENTIIELTGKGTNYVRPPYGAYNYKVREVVESLGFQALVMWSIDTRDWSGASAGSMINEVLNHASCGSIVLFHLHGANTAEALQEIIPQLQSEGYILTSIDKLNSI